jgi:hypothetical protein
MVDATTITVMSVKTSPRLAPTAVWWLWRSNRRIALLLPAAQCEAA